MGIVLLGGGVFAFETGIIAHDSPADAIFANVFTWVWLAMFLGYGRQHLSRTKAAGSRGRARRATRSTSCTRR